jgi:hypothetical protein
VLGLMNSCAAISRLVFPCATSRAICASCAPLKRKGPTVALGTRAWGPKLCPRAEPRPRMTHASAATVALSTEIAPWSSGRRVG